MIRRYLQKLRRVAEAMHFIEHNPLALKVFEKAFRVIHFPALPRQFAVEIFDILQRAANRCLSRPSHARKPNDRATPP